MFRSLNGWLASLVFEVFYWVFSCFRTCISNGMTWFGLVWSVTSDRYVCTLYRWKCCVLWVVPNVLVWCMYIGVGSFIIWFSHEWRIYSVVWPALFDFSLLEFTWHSRGGIVVLWLVAQVACFHTWQEEKVKR